MSECREAKRRGVSMTAPKGWPWKEAKVGGMRKRRKSGWRCWCFAVEIGRAHV